jgi:hypothetical protein
MKTAALSEAIAKEFATKLVKLQKCLFATPKNDGNALTFSD